jgi:DNA-binding CsgD family transcriptional regulator
MDTAPPTIGSSDLVGRDHELAALDHTLTEPTVVLVEGEAGIGKSRLIQEFLAKLPARHRALSGTCPPHRESMTLSPIVDAVRHGVDVGELDLSPLAGALRPLFPEWADDLPPALEPLPDPTADQHRMFRALAELMDRWGANILVVDDVHWADTATVEFVLFLALRHPPPVTLVLTYRPEDLPPNSLLLRLTSRPHAAAQVRLPLRPLDAAGTAKLASSLLDRRPVSTELAGFLQEWTDGVPLAVEESVQLLSQRSDLVYGGAGWIRAGRGDPQVPVPLRDAVLERVGQLSQAARQLLHAYAVLGEAVDEGVAIGVAGLPGDEARKGLAEAMSYGLLEEESGARLTFRHALPRRAVYESLSPSERRRLHRRAGRALERTGTASPLELTRHCREGRESDRWGTHAEKAAAFAAASGDHRLAVLVLADVLAGANLPVPTRVRLARTMVLTALTRRDAVDDLNRRAADLLRELLATSELSRAEEADLRSGLGRLLAQLGELEPARAELELAVPHLDHDPMQAARAMAFLAVPFIGRRPASVHLGWLRRAAEIDTSSWPPADRLAHLVDQAAGLLTLGDEAGWELVDRLPEAGNAAERRHLARGELNIATAALAWGRYETVRHMLLAAQEIADADQNRRLEAKIMIARAQLVWFTGEWDGFAERIVNATEAVGDDQAEFQRTLRLGLLHLARGSLAHAAEHCRRALEIANRMGAVDDLMEPAAALTRLRLAEGDAEGALQVTEEPWRALVAKDVWIWATDIVPARVRALIAVGAAVEAAEVVSRFHDGLGDRAAPGPQAALITCQALLATGQEDHEQAARGFATAAARWDRLPRPYEAALARESEGRCLLAASRFEDGVATLTAAFHALANLGARGDAARVAGLLAQRGVQVSRSWRRGRRGYGNELSPREREVVAQLITGKTNREIAAALSRSPKTVASQVSSAMRKLGVGSRTALAVAAVEAGQVEG